MSSPALRFDPAAHRYWIGDRRIPNVTGVLEYFDEGVRRAKEAHPAAFLAAQDLGTAVHIACELDDKGTLDESTVVPAVGARLEQWRKFRRDKDFVPVLVEKRVYHRVYDYAGTVDRAGALDGCVSINDLKTGVQSRFAGPQTGAYRLAIEMQERLQVQRRYSLHLTSDRYFLVPHADAQDGTVFLSMLNAWRWLVAG